MEEFKVVTKSLDQVVKEMLEGKQFSVKHQFQSYLPVADGTVTMYERVKLSTSASTLWQLLQRGDLYEESHWEDSLDGSWENGVWCLVSYDNGATDYAKVLDEYPCKDGLLYISNLASGLVSANPVPKELAEMLEKHYKETVNNTCDCNY